MLKLYVLVSFTFLSCTPVNQYFLPQKVVAKITDERLVEASGLEESYENPGLFWTHNDSGGDPVVYLIDTLGNVKMEVWLSGIKNIDWEEIVTIKNGDQSFIYVADIGDNKGVRKNISLIRLAEPKYTGESKIEIDKAELEVMPLEYTEGSRDAEAMMYDLGTKEFILITKRESNSMVYTFPFQAGDGRIKISSKGAIPTRNFTAADLNEKGEILLKNYDDIFFWESSEIPAVDRILKWNPILIDYTPEPQGEAMCWYQNNFYTISEKNKGRPQEILFFKRL